MGFFVRKSRIEFSNKIMENKNTLHFHSLACENRACALSIMAATTLASCPFTSSVKALHAFPLSLKAPAFSVLGDWKSNLFISSSLSTFLKLTKTSPLGGSSFVLSCCTIFCP
ncbi:Hypothetical predicted protein [Podarcis lilfordi]|uniref:Uncharacterized protein n=1 Tax=Podarcis lilfordi TaxID=74358 RepID=A0AA35KK48_9SAUR|nr:Hypothetical predicted protein [Podarcis lilfordi]